MSLVILHEDWRDVARFEGYQISNLGRVRSRRHGRGGKLSNYWKLRKWAISNKGYPIVTLILGEERTTKTVHSLVAEAFLGPRPDGMECRHKDGNRMNPDADNLVWGTRSENQMDRADHGTHNRGSKHGQAKLSEEQVAEIRRLWKEGTTQTALAAFYGVSQPHISRICLRQTRAYEE